MVLLRPWTVCDSRPWSGGTQAAGAPISGKQSEEANLDENYGADVATLTPSLPESFAGVTRRSASEGPRTVLVTGVTGFLGAFVLYDLLTKRSSSVAKVYAHVRAKDEANALERLREGCKGRGIWDDKVGERG